MVKFNVKRFLLTLLLIIGVSMLLNYFFNLMNITGIATLFIECLVFSYLLNYISYPRQLRKYCLKDKYFHRNCALSFLFLFLLNYFLWVI